ncbi:energy transducer TonB [Blastomonas sp.]|uniref:energy transducer TonB n=1 Tax=Blastomonas sp. TaxID=1909299 RepID=UPI002615F74D|nr:energy transducer TonB [Blastomonas sp.]MDM7956726.1 energy transducer TonB [Blastomonas sp.]
MIETLFAMLLLPVPVYTPPVISVGSGKAERTLVTWLPGEVRCGGAIVVPAFLERPLSSLSWASQSPASAVTYTFDIDPSGRTMGIRKVGKDARATGSDDIAPSLAATRFAGGSGQSSCTIVYVPRQTGLDAAPVADLAAYSVNAIAGPLPKEAWERIYAEGDCRDERALGLQARVFPNFKAIVANPGVREWSMVGYDISEDGATANIQTVEGTKNAALDLASRKAVEETRYYRGGRKGCRYPYWRGPATLPAPPIPDENQFRPAGATCPARHEWAVQPALRFPEPYRRRAIEGWAIVTYDVAPWGEVSNIQTVASQPTEDFGNQAVIVVRGGKAVTTQGFVGCTDRVKFVIGASEEEGQ